jgi:ABC-type transporter Mla maintaining outer membrane lipid asymmetry ATPase subunit MlaF
VSSPETSLSTATRVEIRDLTVKAGKRLLLEKAHALFEPGSITLIVGASGAGKTILLRILAGLIGPEQAEIAIAGSVRLNDREVLDSHVPRSVGVVFQSFALFDELSPTALRSNRCPDGSPQRWATAASGHRPHARV